MTSQIVHMSLGTPEKTDGAIINPSQHKSPHTRCSQENSSKLTRCCHIVKKCCGEEVRPSAGLCMIAFAVPLIVPGITLTVVAFEDEMGFSKYSALHVLGMVLLALAIMLILAGIVLNTRFKPRFGHDDTPFIVPIHENSTKEADFKIVVMLSAKECHHKGVDTNAGFLASLQPVCIEVQTADNSVGGNNNNHYTTADVDMYSDTGQKNVASSTRKNSKRQCSLSKSFEECSSSFDSFDSEDFSSGSYVLSEDVAFERPTQEHKSAMCNEQEADQVCLFTTFKADHVKKPVFNFDEVENTSNYTAGQHSNFMFPSVDNPTTNLYDASNDERQSSHESKDRKTELIQSNCDELPIEISQTTEESSRFTSEIQVEANSPGSRQRLHGLSSDVLAMSSEVLVTSSESLKTQDVASEENVSGSSSSSVFSLELVVKNVADSKYTDCTKEVIFAQNAKPNQQKTWAQSPSTPRPHSFPSGGGVSKSSGSIGRINSLNEKHIARPQSTDRNPLSDKNSAFNISTLSLYSFISLRQPVTLFLHL